MSWGVDVQQWHLATKFAYQFYDRAVDSLPMRENFCQLFWPRKLQDSSMTSVYDSGNDVEWPGLKRVIASHKALRRPILNIDDVE